MKSIYGLLMLGLSISTVASASVCTVGVDYDKSKVSSARCDGKTFSQVIGADSTTSLQLLIDQGFKVVGQSQSETPYTGFPDSHSPLFVLYTLVK